jgi:hypothetical protein
MASTGRPATIVMSPVAATARGAAIVHRIMSGWRTRTMSTSRSRRATGLAALVSVGLIIALAGPAAAAEPSWQMDFAAGTPTEACAGFDLHVDGYGGGSQAVLQFSRGGGTMVYLQAGTGFAMTFTNMSNGATLSTKASGSVSWTTVYPDGSQKLALLGSGVVILFPSDNGGPSTTLYTGRVTVDVAADGVWTVTKTFGRASDICAALS